MKITLNKDKSLVERIRAGILKKGGYCPCKLAKEEENICICEEFRNQIADPSFEGYCHCKLYHKEK